MLWLTLLVRFISAYSLNRLTSLYYNLHSLIVSYLISGVGTFVPSWQPCTPTSCSLLNIQPRSNPPDSLCSALIPTVQRGDKTKYYCNVFQLPLLIRFNGMKSHWRHKFPVGLNGRIASIYGSVWCISAFFKFFNKVNKVVNILWERNCRKFKGRAC